MWMARTDQLGSATPQRYGLPDPPRLSALNSKSNGPDRNFDPGWFTEKQISRSISFGVSRSRDGETNPATFALVNCSSGNIYKPGRALANQFTFSKAHDQPADRARGLCLLTS